MILRYFALLSTAALGKDVHAGMFEGVITVNFSCRPLQAVHPVCAREKIQAILVLLALVSTKSDKSCICWYNTRTDSQLITQALVETAELLDQAYLSLHKLAQVRSC